MTSLSEAPTTPPQPTRFHVGQVGYIDPRLFEDHPELLEAFEEIPEAIKNLFDDWDQSVLISIETILDEPGLVRTIISVNMEPLNLEYEGHDYFIYNLDFEFTNPTSLHVARVNITPEYFVPDE